MNESAQYSINSQIYYISWSSLCIVVMEEYKQKRIIKSSTRKSFEFYYKLRNRTSMIIKQNIVKIQV